jgi:hypothetical protein
MEPETRYAFVAALEVMLPGVVFLVALNAAAAALVGWLFAGVVAGLVGLPLTYLLGHLAERLIIRPAGRAAEAEVLEMRLLAAARPMTRAERLACSIARMFVPLIRRPEPQLVVGGFSLACLVIGGLALSAPIAVCSALPVVLIGGAYVVMGLFLPRSVFEEDADLREELRSLKVKSLFRLRFVGMMGAMALPAMALAGLLGLVAFKFIQHP